MLLLPRQGPPKKGSAGNSLSIRARHQSWARPLQEPSDEQEKESARWLWGFQQARQLGRACPGTRVTATGDRESDMWSLFDHMDFAPLLATRKIEIAARGGDRHQCGHWVQLQPPKKRSGAEPLEVLAVRVLERDEPQGEQPLEWLLLTSAVQLGKADALRAVQRHENRWGIEEFFRVLKSGMRIQDRQLRTFASLQRCLAFDAVNAWRVFELPHCSREEPETPAREVLSEVEMEVIEDFVQFRRVLPPAQRERPPEDIQGWVVRLARIAGFRPCKRHSLPGSQVL